MDRRVTSIGTDDESQLAPQEIADRILDQALREALSLVAQEVSTIQQIDVAVERGMRWPLGPFKLADRRGLDRVRARALSRLARGGDELDATMLEALDRLVGSGRLGVASGRGFYDYDAPAPAS